MEPYYPCTWLSLVNQKNEKNKKLKFVKKIIYTVPEVYLLFLSIIFQNNCILYAYALNMQTAKTST